MQKLSKKLALLSLIIVLALINWSIYQKENHLAHGTVVYLKLAPVDPRSLMQGDYMRLRFKLAAAIRQSFPQKTVNDFRTKAFTSDGKVIVTLDKNNVATFKALYTSQELLDNEIVLNYRIRQGRVKLATNAFFFQEGKAEVYQKARYGEFRVKDGELLLVDMYDETLQKLGQSD